MKRIATEQDRARHASLPEAKVRLEESTKGARRARLDRKHQPVAFVLFRRVGDPVHGLDIGLSPG